MQMILLMFTYCSFMSGTNSMYSLISIHVCMSVFMHDVCVCVCRQEVMGRTLETVHSPKDSL